MSQNDKVAPPTRLNAIVVETSSVKHKTYRQEPQDESFTEHQRLSKAPVVPPVAEELKNIEEASVLDDDEKKDLKTVKSEKLKHRDTAASQSRPRGQSPEKKAMAALESTKHKIPLAQPIPPVAGSKPVASPVPEEDKDGLESTSTYSVPAEPDAEAAEVAAAERRGVWSDDEEAGGLPRDTHGSRMARAFRRLLCLGSDDSDDFDTKPVKHELDESPRTEDSVEPIGINNHEEIKLEDNEEEPTENEGGASFPSGYEEMSCSHSSDKKRAISWNSKAYQRVNLQDLVAKNQGWILVPKASMLNAKPGEPIQVPSGITICLPVKKSTRNLSDSWRSSGISITVSKKQLPAKSQTNGEGDKGKCEKAPRRKWDLEISDGPKLQVGTHDANNGNGFRSFRDKCDRIWCRFKTTLVW